jgi:hypothetical protein
VHGAALDRWRGTHPHVRTNCLWAQASLMANDTLWTSIIELHETNSISSLVKVPLATPHHHTMHASSG